MSKSPAITTMWRRVILSGALALFAGLGVFLGGIAPGQLGFNDRGTAGLSRHKEAVGKSRGDTTNWEHPALAGDDAGGAPWSVHVEQADKALAERNFRGAEQAWHDAYLAALGSRRWEGMIEVGDASLRIGEATGTRKASEARARKAYLAALARARQVKSLDGVLRTAEAFAGLGDPEVVQQSIRIAESLAAQSRDTHAYDRVRAFQERLATGSVEAKSSAPIRSDPPLPVP